MLFRSSMGTVVRETARKVSMGIVGKTTVQVSLADLRADEAVITRIRTKIQDIIKGLADAVTTVAAIRAALKLTWQMS